MLFSGDRHLLKADAVPTVFSFKPSPSTSSARNDRAKKRRKLEIEQQENIPPVPEIGNMEEVETEGAHALQDDDMGEDKSVSSSVSSHAVQCELLTDRTQRWTIDMYENDDKAILYYTGFDNYRHFNFVFDLLGPAAYELNFRCDTLTPKDQFFLTMIKIRQAKEDVELSLFFKISTTLVSKICTTWINFMYYQFKEIPLWASRDTIQQHMPSGFKQFFPNTRVILDATEIPIMKPSNVNAQSKTYSTDKNRNTLKTMIGITPMGAVSHVSSCYGGSASDRQVIERSDLVEQGKFEKGDAIMADRGIMVQDLFAAKDVYVNTPTMLKGKAQLEAETVVRDRRISSKRIHVERVIGNAKRIKILSQTLPPTKVNMGSKIVFVTFFLTNLRKCVVSRWA